MVGNWWRGLTLSVPSWTRAEKWTLSTRTSSRLLIKKVIAKILSVLQQQGLRSNLLAQFDSYLHKRFQRVIALTVSSRAVITLGVPQG